MHTNDQMHRARHGGKTLLWFTACLTDKFGHVTGCDGLLNRPLATDTHRLFKRPRPYRALSVEHNQHPAVSRWHMVRLGGQAMINVSITTSKQHASKRVVWPAARRRQDVHFNDDVAQFGIDGAGQ